MQVVVVGLRFCPSCRSVYTAHIDFCGIDGEGLLESEEDALVGCEIDRYLVLERIGVGATGCVYRVEHAALETEHAMKVLYGDLSQDARITERFRREAKAASKIRHPNILSVTDFGRTDRGLTFLVMEIVRGVTLEDEIIYSAPFSVERASRIVEQIAGGLGAAHRLGFVHRDVKPTNIMLTPEDGAEQVKILDFGIVGLRTESLDMRLTAAGFLIGTPAYMAPEQAIDPSGVTPAADFYSLGIILYEMLTGKLPFAATQPVDMIVQHSIAPVPELPPSGGLEQLAKRLLAKNPAERPQSAEEILDAIARMRLELCDAETQELGRAEIDPRDLPLLEPVTYHGPSPRVVYFEDVCRKLRTVRETLTGSISLSDELRRTFDARLVDLVTAARPGLHARHYSNLAEELSALEDELLLAGRR